MSDFEERRDEIPLSGSGSWILELIVIKYRMKCIIKQILIGFALVILSSCHHNRLKVNEKELTEKILIQEEQMKEAIRNYRPLTNASASGTNSLRYKGDRSVDPLHPPLIIDIAGNLDNIKEIKLSDVFTEIKYIRLQPPPDSAFKDYVGFRYYMTDNSIVAFNIFGMIHYSRDGRYLNTIVKNQFTKIEVTPDYIMSYYDMTFIGALNPNIKTSGNKLLYSYLNNIAGQEYLMEYDCSELQFGQTQEFDPENPLKILGSGKIIGDLNHGKAKYTPDKRNPGAEIYTIQSTGMSWIDDNFYMKKLGGDDMMAIFSKDGDTLTTFKQLETLINYTKNLQRGVDRGEQYEFNGMTFFRNAFNDTVFQVIPPKRLLPVYVINVGNYKVSRQQGVDPGYDLTGNIIPQDWAVTSNFIFLTFVKDGYDSPNSRKEKKVKIYHALYSKNDRQFSVLNGDPFDYKPEILENNIDGGIPVWPESYMVSKNGEIMISLKGKDLKERIKSEQFKSSAASELKKNELKQLAGSVSDNEDILMIIK